MSEAFYISEDEEDLQESGRRAGRFFEHSPMYQQQQILFTEKQISEKYFGGVPLEEVQEVIKEHKPEYFI